MPRFQPATNFVPKSAVTVPPALRNRKIPNPSPAGGAKMGAPAHGLQYGNKVATGKGWIVRQRGREWVRMSPKSWRQPKRRLHPALKNAGNGAAAGAKGKGEQPVFVPLKKPAHNLGWGVTAPAKGQAKPGAGARGKALQAAGAAAVPAVAKDGPTTRAAAAAKGEAARPPLAARDGNLRC